MNGCLDYKSKMMIVVPVKNECTKVLQSYKDVALNTYTSV